MATIAQQSVNYNVVMDMIYRLSEKDRTRLVKEITDLTEKKTVGKGYTYDVVPPELQKELDEARADYKAGKCITFNNKEEMLKHYNAE
ncbi:MAG: hypothetical protein LBG17_08425 [Bacteroidales bacterium]|jgi:hypothetical protein|nr:hypothetical protein [Bacteroidales bacterium]